MAVNATKNNVKWPLQLVFLTLLAALAYLIARIVISLTNPESLWVTHDALRPAKITSSVKYDDFSFTNDPFNKSNVQPLTTETVLNEDVPETTLNLKMTGRIAGNNGSAILRTSDNKEAVYRIDEEVISDVILKAVNKDFVVLSVNGQLQRLTFDRDEDTGLTKTKTSIAKVAAAPSTSSDILSMLQSVNLQRSVKNGQLQGYKVKSNRPGLDIGQFGLKRGDVVTKFDGKDITQGNIDLLKLFQEASQKGQVDLTVLRNGQTRTIQLGN